MVACSQNPMSKPPMCRPWSYHNPQRGASSRLSTTIITFSFQALSQCMASHSLPPPPHLGTSTIPRALRSEGDFLDSPPPPRPKLTRIGSAVRGVIRAFATLSPTPSIWCHHGGRREMITGTAKATTQEEEEEGRGVARLRRVEEVLGPTPRRCGRLASLLHCLVWVGCRRTGRRV